MKSNNNFLNSMKQYLLHTLIASIAIFSATSCSDWMDDEKLDYDKIAFGTVTRPIPASATYDNGEIPIKECIVVTDDSLWLYPTNVSEMTSYKAIEGQRVILYYKYDEGGTTASVKYVGAIQGNNVQEIKKKNVKVARIQNILTKGILNTNRIDTVKNDPATLYDACFGSNVNTGKRYLNIYFVAAAGMYKPHYIYLVNDLTAGNPVNSEGYYCLEMRHDANDDIKQQTSGAYASFILDPECYADGIKGISIKFTNEFNEEKRTKIPFTKVRWSNYAD
jgi:hypothetical protein